MKRMGFTLVELIFSILILGILSAVTADIIAHIYSRYLASLEIERAQSDTRRALDILSARLSNRVKNSAIGRKMDALPTNDKAFVSLDDEALQTNVYEMLQWVGIAYESQRGEGENFPMGIYIQGGGCAPSPSCNGIGGGDKVLNGWSGIAYSASDISVVGSTLKKDLISPLSEMNISKSVEARQNYYFGEFPSGGDYKDPFAANLSVLVFAGSDTRGDYYGRRMDNWGWDNVPSADQNITNYFAIDSVGNVDRANMESRFTIASLGDQNKLPPSFYANDDLAGYYITRSAYALWVDKDSNLMLAYNYRPWKGDYYDNVNKKIKVKASSGYTDAQSSKLLKNVTSFLFSETGGVMRLILCVRAGDNVAGSNDDNATQFCRERIVI